MNVSHEEIVPKKWYGNGAKYKFEDRTSWICRIMNI